MASSIQNHIIPGDPELLKALDLMSELFTVEYLETICDHITFFVDKQKKSGKPIVFETNEERIFMMIEAVTAIIGRPDPLRTAIEQVEKMDIGMLVMLATNTMMKEGKPPMPEGSLYEDLAESENYLAQFLTAYTNSEEGKEAAIELLKDNKKFDELIKQYPQKEKEIKLILSYSIAAKIEKQYKDYDKKSLEDVSSLVLFHAFKQVVNEFKGDYDLWQSCYKDMGDALSLIMILHAHYLDNKEESIKVKAMVLCCFLTYWAIYSDHRNDYLFGERLSKICSCPVNIAKLIRYLQAHEFGGMFADKYKEYCEEKGIVALFDTTQISSGWPEPKEDTEISHRDWYRKIPATKVATGTNKRLAYSLRKLYKKLIELGLVDNLTPENLFIYRFSGFLPSFELGSDLNIIGWLGTNYEYAILLDMLYRTHNDLPNAKTYNKFFFPGIKKDANKTYVNKCPKDVSDKMRDLLLECGFINVDPSKIK